MHRLAAAFLIAVCCASARAEDLTGRFGVGVTGGAGFPIGSKYLYDRNGGGPAVGGWAAYGLDPRWTARLSYDNISLASGHARIQPAQAGLGYLLCPNSAWNPTLRGGLGAWNIKNVTGTGHPVSFGFSLGLSLDKFVTDDVSVGAALDWFATAWDGNQKHDTHLLRPGVSLGWWFGKPEARPVAAAPAPAPAPAPARAERAPEPAPAPAPAPAAKKRVEIALNVEFETAKDVVRRGYDPELSKVADFMKEHPASTAEIEGHTDDVGGAEYNKKLSQRRADAVRRALIERFHIDGSRLTAKGYGEERPIADNKTPEGRAKNRRVVASFSAVE